MTLRLPSRERLEAAARRVGEDAGLRLVILFGSVARLYGSGPADGEVDSQPGAAADSPLPDAATDAATAPGDAEAAGRRPADAGARSPADVDLGVTGEGPVDPVEVTNRFIRELGVQQVDVSDLARADPLLRMLAVRDGRVLYEAEPGAFVRFVSVSARRYADTKKFRRQERRAIRDFLERTAAGGP